MAAFSSSRRSTRSMNWRSSAAATVSVVLVSSIILSFVVGSHASLFIDPGENFADCCQRAAKFRPVNCP
ncbi:exported hypothetical protein [Agrobacterium salinitolerans str. Hayward 0363]|nr:exported hypothetical protein [Agrobacterium salinitolerans str. Hayward 0363]